MIRTFRDHTRSHCVSFGNLQSNTNRMPSQSVSATQSTIETIRNWPLQNLIQLFNFVMSQFIVQ